MQSMCFHVNWYWLVFERNRSTYFLVFLKNVAKIWQKIQKWVLITFFWLKNVWTERICLFIKFLNIFTNFFTNFYTLLINYLIRKLLMRLCLMVTPKPASEQSKRAKQANNNLLGPTGFYSFHQQLFDVN